MHLSGPGTRELVVWSAVNYVNAACFVWSYGRRRRKRNKLVGVGILLYNVNGKGSFYGWESVLFCVMLGYFLDLTLGLILSNLVAADGRGHTATFTRERVPGVGEMGNLIKTLERSRGG